MLNWPSRAYDYHDPDHFISYLQSLPLLTPRIPEAPDTRLGYKIKRSAPKLTGEEQRLKEDAAIRSIAAEMQRRV